MDERMDGGMHGLGDGGMLRVVVGEMARCQAAPTIRLSRHRSTADM